MGGAGVEKVHRTLDCRGVLCPTPVLRISAAIKNMKVGEVIELLTTDPGAKRDVPAWSQRAKHQLLRIKEEGGVCKFYVRKAG